MKAVLNFHTGKLCSEVVSFWRSEIWVWRLSSDFVNNLPFGFYKHFTIEIKAVCLTNASLAMHSNVIEKLMNYKIQELIIIA